MYLARNFFSDHDQNSIFLQSNLIVSQTSDNNNECHELREIVSIH